MYVVDCAGRFLLVIDNVCHPSQLICSTIWKQLYGSLKKPKTMRNGHVLITSRVARWEETVRGEVGMELLTSPLT